MGCHFLPPRDLPVPGTEPISHVSPAVEGRFFTTSATWEAPICPIFIYQINAHRGSWVNKILTTHVFVDFHPLLPHLRLKFYLCDLLQESPFSDPCNTCCLSSFPFLSVSFLAFSNPSAIFLLDTETSPAHRGWPWGKGFILDFQFTFCNIAQRLNDLWASYLYARSSAIWAYYSGFSREK